MWRVTVKHLNAEGDLVEERDYSHDVPDEADATHMAVHSFLQSVNLFGGDSIQVLALDRRPRTQRGRRK